ncbi:hypothetical protein KODAMA_01620 [Serratia phage vB_SmaM-Kodama]|nr:hypothetical protein KODAMA_01620 [Serratia phage vB_SmaM-Kodama]
MKPGNLGKTPVTGTHGYVADSSFYPSNQPCVRRKVTMKRSRVATAVGMEVWVFRRGMQ